MKWVWLKTTLSRRQRVRFLRDRRLDIGRGFHIEHRETGVALFRRGVYLLLADDEIRALWNARKIS